MINVVVCCADSNIANVENIYPDFSETQTILPLVILFLLSCKCT